MNERRLSLFFRRCILITAPAPALSFVGCAPSNAELHKEAGQSAPSGAADAASSVTSMPQGPSAHCVPPPSSYTIPLSLDCVEGTDSGLDDAGPADGALCKKIALNETLDSTDCKRLGCSLSCSVEAHASSVYCFSMAPGCSGRLPLFFIPNTYRALDAVAAYLARTAELEAASVHAFRHLARELMAHRAPCALVHAAQRAARDERRHARATVALARRFGATCRPPVVSTPGVRSLRALAEENAVEGCVRETYGALLATFQATRAADTSIRAAMQRIARDETRHAALAWRIASWAERRVDQRSRKRIAAARRDAFGRLLAALDEPSAAMVHTLGLPTRTQSLALARNLLPLISRTA